MKTPSDRIDLAAYERRLNAISVQLDENERSLVLRFAQDLLLLCPHRNVEAGGPAPMAAASAPPPADSRRRAH